MVFEISKHRSGLTGYCVTLPEGQPSKDVCDGLFRQIKFYQLQDCCLHPTAQGTEIETPHIRVAGVDEFGAEIVSPSDVVKGRFRRVHPTSEQHSNCSRYAVPKVGLANVEQRF